MDTSPVGSGGNQSASAGATTHVSGGKSAKLTTGVSGSSATSTGGSTTGGTLATGRAATGGTQAQTGSVITTGGNPETGGTSTIATGGTLPTGGAATGETGTGGLPAVGGSIASANCPNGSERCPCYGNNTCNAGLTCASELCVAIGIGGAGAGGAAGVGAAGGPISSGGTAGSSGCSRYSSAAGTCQAGVYTCGGSVGYSVDGVEFPCASTTDCTAAATQYTSYLTGHCYGGSGGAGGASGTAGAAGRPYNPYTDCMVHHTTEIDSPCYTERNTGGLTCTASGQCNSCKAGWLDCDADGSNGCETLKDDANCTQCGSRCLTEYGEHCVHYSNTAVCEFSG
jgi:hypothetical protein